MPMLQIQSRKAASIFFSACLMASSVTLLPQVAQAALPEFADIVERTSPAVVNISATSKAKPAEIDQIKQLVTAAVGAEHERTPAAADGQAGHHRPDGTGAGRR